MPATKIYAAMRSEARRPSTYLGAFSTPQRARDACQEHADEVCADERTPALVLRWDQPNVAHAGPGVIYDVTDSTLDQRIRW